jgi:riboflavin synthase
MISATRVVSDVKTGDSICTNGICLTVTQSGTSYFTVDAMPETIRKTSLSNLKQGSKVNLERALRLSDRLGGHLVSGHVDGTGKIGRIQQDDNAIRINILTDSAILKYIIDRGSVAVDGVSLTVTHVDDRSFGVSIIPHTQTVTTLSFMKTGDPVNIECDMIAKYTEKLTSYHPTKSTITKEFLTNNGYL